MSAKLSFGQGSAARIAFDLSYHGNRVTGFIGSQKEPLKKREVDEAVADDTVDQRIDWAAVMALEKYVEGQEFRFHVYDSGTGNSLVRVRIGESQTTTVPAGSFETVRVSYRIDRRSGPEPYEVFVTKQAPRFLAKEKFPNGSITELVELTKSTSDVSKRRTASMAESAVRFELADTGTCQAGALRSVAAGSSSGRRTIASF